MLCWLINECESVLGDWGQVSFPARSLEWWQIMDQEAELSEASATTKPLRGKDAGEPWPPRTNLFPLCWQGESLLWERPWRPIPVLCGSQLTHCLPLTQPSALWHEVARWSWWRSSALQHGCCGFLARPLKLIWALLGGPMAKTPCSQGRGPRVHPWSGN